MKTLLALTIPFITLMCTGADDGYQRAHIEVLTAQGKVSGRLVTTESDDARRLLVMVPGTLANGGGYYDVHRGTGYDAAELLASAGYAVLIPDLPGTGYSYRPADGRKVSTSRMAEAVSELAQSAAILTGARSVDIYGETGLGSNIVLELASEPWVRSVILSAPAYLQLGPAMAPALSPDFGELLDAAPSGYLPQDTEQIGAFLPLTPEALIPDIIHAVMGPAPRTLPVGPYNDLRSAAGEDSAQTLRLERPIVSAEPARAPALVIAGLYDPTTTLEGVEELVQRYGEQGGGAAELLTLPGAHLMRFEELADGPGSPYWSAVLAFLASR